MSFDRIKIICENYGIKPSKSFGQNFLIDDNIIDKIISSANLKSTDKVLEIGPGPGVLTDKLVEKVDQLFLCELDKKIINFIEVNYKKQISSNKIKLITGDALKIDFKKEGLIDFDFKIVSNLPYSITSGFFRKFLEFGPKPSEIIVMIQKEVAQRIISKPGKMNLLALSVQFFAEPKILFDVSPHCFWPEPEIDSSVISLKLKKKLPEVDIKLMFRLMKFGFSSKRKQLHNNLVTGLKSLNIKVNNLEIKLILKEIGLDEEVRAQDLSLDNWFQLVNKIK